MTALTVNAKVSNVVRTGIPVSVTVKVIFETPVEFVVGVIVAIQFGAVPLKTIFATGTSAGLEEAADIEVKQFIGLSSVMVNGITRGTSSNVLRGPMADKIGASLISRT